MRVQQVFSLMSLGVYSIFILGWALGSGTLIIGLWVKHRHDSGIKKLFWSVVLLFPVFGWLFYGAFYTPPSRNEFKAQGGASGWFPLYK